MSHRARNDGKRLRRGQEQPAKEVVNTDGQQEADTESSPVTDIFRQFQTELDARHDKYERLVKLSRDVTITSKRIIFSIHRVNSEDDRAKVILDIETKLNELERTKWYQIARELSDEDPYMYLRAYTPGLQEYVEAVCLYYYTKNRVLADLPTIQRRLTFVSIPAQQSTGNLPADVSAGGTKLPHDSSTTPAGMHWVPVDAAVDAASLDISTAALQHPTSPLNLSVLVPPVDYVLGLADVTGELMRLAIHSAGVGNTKTPFDVCGMLREVCTALGSFDNGVGRDWHQKLSTLRQSVAKVEAACYAMRVRASELPCHSLATVPVFAPLPPLCVVSVLDNEHMSEYVD